MLRNIRVSYIYLVAFLLIAKYMTLNDFEWLEWSFYVKFTLLPSAFE